MKTEARPVSPLVHEVVKLFSASLNQGMGDLETMLAGLRYRILHPSEKLDPNARPPGYRSQILRDQLKKEFGARRTSLWGGTALRGNFDPRKKSHIIQFLKSVNKLPADPRVLKLAFGECARLYAKKVNDLYPAIILPEDAPAQRQLLHALSTPSEGKAQQGIAYALLRLLCKYAAPGRTVETKPTHAGDAQSQRPGDIQVLQGNALIAVYEVKAFQLDQAGVDRLLPTHGKHDYPLFVLAESFKPTELKTALSSMGRTFAISLVDYCLAVFSELCLVTGRQPDELLREVIEVYNEEFCEKIENDESIKIRVSTQKKL